jgi:hypothetical protein
MTRFFQPTRQELAMPLSRLLAPAALLLLSVAGCASAPVRREAATPDITVDLSIPPERARERVTAAFEANGLVVASSQPGMVEFHAPRERGILGFDDVFARALIAPADCGTRITIFGETTHYPSSTAREGTVTRLGPSSTGRAHDVWVKLQSVASTLRGDSTRVRT